MTDPSLFEFYRSVATDGGGIGTELMVSSLMDNEFQKISTSDRANGIILYSKQFIKNTNPADWENVLVFFKSLTTKQPYTTITMCLSGSKSKLYDSVELSGTATVTASGYFETSVDLRPEIGVGEWVYNSTDDPVSFAIRVSEVTPTYIQLHLPYAGTMGTAKKLSVAPATYSSYAYPTAKDHPLISPPVTIPTGGAIAVWKRYEVVAGCPQYANDWFTIKLEET